MHLVAALLGQSNISTTSVYLNATRVGLHDAMRAIDERRRNDEPQPMPTVERQDAPLVN